MNRNFSGFTLTIEEKKFTNENGITFQKTAVLTCHITDPRTGEITKEIFELGWIETDEIYKLIDNKNEINLNECYIKDFSLSAYRESRNLPETEFVQINDFSAAGSFFDSDTTIDFSRTEFNNSNINFNKCIFNNQLSFVFAEFGSGDVDFEYTLFNDGNVDFSSAIFGSGNLSFKNAIFKQGKKNFDAVNFGDGNVTFMGTDFRKGNVNFANSVFYTGKINFKAANFGDGKIDFSHVNFGKGDVILEKVNFGKGNVNFRSAKFDDGKIDFNRSTFGKGEVSFMNAEFGNGSATFVDTDFNDGKVNFKLAVFRNGKIDFHFSKFGVGDVIFDRAAFGDGLIDFRAVDFNTGKVNFFRSEFGNGDIIFEGIKLKEGRAIFKHTFFGSGSINFEMAEFGNADLVFDRVNFGEKSASFYKVKVNTLLLHACHVNNYFDMRVTKCDTIDLSDSIVRDIIDITPYDFKVDFKYLNMSGIRLLGQIYIDWDANNVKEHIYKQYELGQQQTENKSKVNDSLPEETNDGVNSGNESSDSKNKFTFRSMSEQFRVLKENYNEIGRYTDEDEAYVEFKRTEAKANLEDAIARNPKFKLFYYARYFFQWLIFDKVGLYATNPVRVLLSMIIIYFCFVLVYITLNLSGYGNIIYGIGDEHVLTAMGKCFYFSAVTFLTIGYGDFYPVGINRALAGIEGFVGLFLMSYFTVAFVRKILR